MGPKGHRRSERRAARAAAVNTLTQFLVQTAPASDGFSESNINIVDMSNNAEDTQSHCNHSSIDLDNVSLRVANRGSESQDLEVMDDSSDKSYQSHFTDTAHNASTSSCTSNASNSSSSVDDDGDDSDLVYLLGNWATKHNITQSALDDLLIVLGSFHPHLPRCAKTVMCTPRGRVPLKVLDNGVYCHRGFFEGLLSKLRHGINPDSLTINVDINIDGVSVFKNCPQSAWSILGRSRDLVDSRPFIIGMFYGIDKPKPIGEYLADFVADTRQLRAEGLLLDGNQINVDIRNFICDAPARSYLKCVLGHSSTNGCERCDQEGEWNGRQTVFSTRSGNLRTDESFHTRVDPDHHHVTISPLESDLNIRCISQVVLDLMHLRDLCVTNRFLEFILGRAPPIARMSADMCRRANELLIQLGPFIPSEFSRKPRPFLYLHLWKATEFRLFVLYIGIVILKPVVREEVYDLFLLLHCAMYITSNEGLINHLDNAEIFLENFVQYSSQIFGPEFVSYYIHNLLHWVDEVRRHGNPEQNLSAYPFENYNQIIKKLVRSRARPLQQIIKRLLERENFDEDLRGKDLGLFQEYTGGPLGGLENVQEFKKCVINEYQLRLSENDNAVLVPGDRVGRVMNIVKQGEQVKLVVKLFRSYDTFYEYPLPSTELGISVVTNLDNVYHIFDLLEVKSKCMLLPYEGKLVALPILHTCKGVHEMVSHG